MKAILLAGAGSVGKTKLLEAIQDLAVQRGISSLAHRSTTRQTYAKAGIVNEGEQMRRLGEANHEGVEELMLHQHQVMSDNTQALVTAAQQGYKDHVDILVADRTPYDYSTYFCNVFQTHITLKDIEAKRREADAALQEVMMRADEGVYVLYFPFPAHWSQDTVSSDGWRADKTGKNFLWSSLVNSELDEAQRRFSSDTTLPTTSLPFFGRLDAFAERSSAEQRAASVLGMAMQRR